MILLVAGDDSRAEKLPPHLSASEILAHILAAPAVVLAAQHFTQQPLRVISIQNPGLPTGGTREIERGRESALTTSSVYVAQGERASPLPQHVQVAGTDEMTTCVGVVMWNPANRRACVAHLDSPKGMPGSMRGMADSIGALPHEAVDVHLTGCFDDSDTWQHPQPPTLAPPAEDRTTSISEAGDSPAHTSPSPRRSARMGAVRRKGFSHATAVALFRALQESVQKFVVRTAVVLHLNTRAGPSGHPCPIVRGLAVNLHSGSVFPARFTPPARGPCLELRGWCTLGGGSLSDPYDPERDVFVVRPTRFVDNSSHYQSLLCMTDEDLLQNFSTSPNAESEDFVPHARRLLALVARAPKHADMFPNNNPLCFTRKVTWQQANHDVSHARGIADGDSGHGVRYLAERGTGGTDAQDMDALSGWVQMVAEA